MAKKNKLPFEEIRILDLGMFWAAPYATSYLGSLGAEVIKVESIQRVDSYRYGQKVADMYWEKYAHWNITNVSKLGLTLDLSRPRGIELFKELVKVSDIVIDNFSARVMKNFGLDYAELKKVKSDIIVASMPSYGLTGPWKDFVGFGTAFEQASGFAYLTGYRDDYMRFITGGAGDPIAAMHTVFAIQAALEYRRKTGKGQLVDVSQVEASTVLLGPAVLDYSMNKRVWGPMQNQDPMMAPHGIFPCKDNDTWVVIAVETDGEWKALCGVIGKRELADDEKYTTFNERWKNQDELTDIISEWTKQHTPYEAMIILQKAGIAAGAVNRSWEMFGEPQLEDRGYFYTMEREHVGEQKYYGYPVKFSETKMKYYPAPTVGQHNEYILGKILNLSDEEIAKLKEDKIIGNAPVGIASKLA